MPHYLLHHNFICYIPSIIRCSKLVSILIGFRSLWTCRALLSDQTVNVNAQQSSQEQSRESDEEYEKNIKSKILVASLAYVHDLGWSQQAISAGNL